MSTGMNAPETFEKYKSVHLSTKVECRNRLADDGENYLGCGWKGEIKDIIPDDQYDQLWTCPVCKNMLFFRKKDMRKMDFSQIVYLILCIVVLAFGTIGYYLDWWKS